MYTSGHLVVWGWKAALGVAIRTCREMWQSPILEVTSIYASESRSGKVNGKLTPKTASTLQVADEEALATCK